MSSIKNATDQPLASEIKEYLKTAPEIYLAGVSVDTVIFGFDNDKLHVLLLRFSNTPYYTLAGGYIEKEEDLDHAALRILSERTGLKNIYLEQFYTSGKHNRTNTGITKYALKKLTGILPPGNWLDQRFISVCYYALVDETKVEPKIQEPFTSGFKWFEINKLPKLLFDHKFIIEKALSRLQADLDTKLIGFNLMNETFTMNQLQKLYEAVHQMKLVRTNFQRKMLTLGVLERLEKQYNGKSHKAPYLYRFILAK